MSNDLLDADQGKRLANLLGMMGSSHDGEALNAARLADRLVRARGLTWHEVINALAAAPEIGGAQQLARTILRDHSSVLDEREAHFVQSMTRWHGVPSEKQRRWLDNIAARYRGTAV